jgi:hypothetical protein
LLLQLRLYCLQYPEEWLFPSLRLPRNLTPNEVENRRSDCISWGWTWRGRQQIRRQVLCSRAGGCGRFGARCIFSLFLLYRVLITERKHRRASVGSCSFQPAIHSLETSSAHLILPSAILPFRSFVVSWTGKSYKRRSCLPFSLAWVLISVVMLFLLFYHPDSPVVFIFGS